MTTKNATTPSAIVGLGQDSLGSSTKAAIQVGLFSLQMLGLKLLPKKIDSGLESGDRGEDGGD